MVVTDDGLGSTARHTGGVNSPTSFNEMAVGIGATAGNSPGSGQSALQNETNRDTDVTGTTEQTNFAEDTQRYVGTFNFSSDRSLTEFGVFNGATTDVMLLYQIFAEVLEVENGDTLDVTVDVVTTMPNNDTTTGADDGGSVITQEGVQATNQLMVTDVSDPTHGAFDALALGSDDGSLEPISDDDSALGSEFTTNGLARQAATVTQETTNVTGSNGGGDTTRFNASWTVDSGAGQQDINEVGVFNTTTQGDADEILLYRHIFPNTLNFQGDDTLDFTVDVINSG